MKKITLYTNEQVETMKTLINGLILTGSDNFKKAAILMQILDAGAPGEMAEEEKKEVEKECHTNHTTQ